MKDQSNKIEKFVWNEIKKECDDIDEAAFKVLFDGMTTEEISLSWYHYSSLKAFSEANIAVPDWETKKQEKYFTSRANSYSYYAKKDENGKYVIDREALIDHIKIQLSEIIRKEIHKNRNFRSKTFF